MLLQLLGGGTWGTKAKRDMKEKYFLSRKQHDALEPPSLKGTKLYTAVKGFDFGSYGKALSDVHQQTRSLAKLALREHETFSVAGKEMDGWELPDIKDDDGNLVKPYALTPAKQFRVDQEGDEEKIQEAIVEMRKDGGERRAAIDNMQQRRAIRHMERLYLKMAELYAGTRVKAELGRDMQKNLVKVHWDLLQHLGQVDLGIWALRRTSIERYLTPKMRNRLKAENGTYK